MNKLIISNNYKQVKDEINAEIKSLKFLDMNYLKINDKIDVFDLIPQLNSFPFMDEKKVFYLDISLYSKAELKEILNNLSSDTTTILFVFFLKDKLDKLDNTIIKLFQKFNISVIKYNNIKQKDIMNLMQEKQMNLDPNLFVNADNLDVINNDLDKIKCISNSTNLNEFISESFDNNIFELIEFILKKDVTNSLKKLDFLLIKENPIKLNLVFLKQFNELRIIKNANTSNPKEIEKILVNHTQCTEGKKAHIHPFRLKMLIESANSSKIDLNYAVNELVQNDVTKKFDLKISLLKIFNARW